MHTIDSIKPILISSDYGNNKVLGQPLGLKTIGIIKVTTKDGVFGYGESYIAIYVPELFEHLVFFLENKIKNKCFNDPREIYDSFYIPFCSSNGLLASIYSAIDIALWDITCKKANKSLNEFLGIEKNENFKYYFSGGSAAFKQQELEEEINKVNKNIFKGYKMRIGRQNWGIDQERIKTARKKWDQYLMIDAIMGTIRPAFKSNDWENKLEFISRYAISWLEEPLDPENINGLEEVKKLNNNIPLALGESLTGKLGIRSFLNNQYLDFLQLDITHCGGISMLISMMHELKKSKKRITMHVWGSPLAFIANLKFASILENVEWVEYPGVKLHCFEKEDSNYYSNVPDFKNYICQPSFTNINFTKTKEQYPFVSGTGFSLK